MISKSEVEDTLYRLVAGKGVLDVDWFFFGEEIIVLCHKCKKFDIINRHSSSGYGSTDMMEILAWKIVEHIHSPERGEIERMLRKTLLPKRWSCPLGEGVIEELPDDLRESIILLAHHLVEEER